MSPVNPKPRTLKDLVDMNFFITDQFTPVKGAVCDSVLLFEQQAALNCLFSAAARSHLFTDLISYCKEAKALKLSTSPSVKEALF